MVGREKIDTDDIVNKDLTIIGFDFADKRDRDTGELVVDHKTGEVQQFAVVVFAEYPDKYYSVGTVFTKVCEAWADQFGGDPEDASAQLAAEGGVRVRFTRGTTRKGNNVTNVTIL